MSVYLRGGVWWMDFWYRGVRVRKSTGQLDREAAEAVERAEKDRRRQAAHGVAITAKPLTPRFQDWAEVYYEEAAKKLRRPDRIEFLTRVALGFWGARPKNDASIYPDAPYHDLRLADPIDDPAWLLQWESWLAAPKRSRPRKDGRPVAARAWSGQTKNQYRSLLSQFYALAIKPAWRSTTGVSVNPFVGGDRDRVGQRIVALELEDLREIIQHARPHLQLAIAIALLAPKLRLGDILRLRFDTHVSADLEWLTVHDHKTSHQTHRPLVAYIPQQLREILTVAKARATKTRPWIIQYRGQPVSEVRGSVQSAVERAAVERPGLKYGRFAIDGISFHTLRHSAATQLAVLGVTPDVRQGLMGHGDMTTTLLYTHLRPMHEIGPAESLSDSWPIADLITGVGNSVTTHASNRGKSREKQERASQPLKAQKPA